MRSMMFLLISVIILLSGCKSQNSAIKDTQLAEDKVKYEKALEALNNHQFIIESDRIKVGSRRYHQVSTIVNFVSMNKKNATVQLAYDMASNSYNGMGGVTFDGIVSNVKTSTDKKGNTSFSMNVYGPQISAVVNITLVAGSNQCYAVVIPNNYPESVTYAGYILPLSDADVLKGFTR